MSEQKKVFIDRDHFDERVRLAAGPDADEEFSADFLDGVKVVLYMLSTETPADVKPVVKGEWIPVTERLPEIDMTFPHSEWYLVQYEDGYMDVASWSNVNRFWTDLVTEPHWNCAQFQTVVAWMSLPEPYRKEEANDNENYA